MLPGQNLKKRTGHKKEGDSEIKTKETGFDNQVNNIGKQPRRIITPFTDKEIAEAVCDVGRCPSSPWEREHIVGEIRHLDRSTVGQEKILAKYLE